MEYQIEVKNINVENQISVIKAAGHLGIKNIRHITKSRIYSLNSNLAMNHIILLAENLYDPVISRYEINPDTPVKKDSWIVDISYKKGMTDPEADIIRNFLPQFLGNDFNSIEKIYITYRYLIESDINEDELLIIIKKILANPIIEKWEYKRI